MTTNSTYTSDYEYTYEPENQEEVGKDYCRDAMCIILSIIKVMIFILGVAGNALVIWIAGFKLKKSVNTTWYLSLALSDFLFCCFLPFSIDYTIRKSWIFGRIMCKFISFILYLNMFSSIFLLVIISVDRCVVVMFPVWAQNKRTIKKSSVIVLLVWIISAALSTPSAWFRDILSNYHHQTYTCYNNFQSEHSHSAVVSSRFVFGFVIPFMLIYMCYLKIILRLNINQSARSKKPLKIMTVLIITFFICWLPFHTVALMELDHTKYEHILPTGQVFGFTLASVNSCLNPFLYAFMGKDFKRKCNKLLSKIENAIDEEGRSTVRGTSITTSGERRASTVI